MKGRSLELFFVDGNPDGMLTAEVFNWTGHVLRIPRTQLAEGLKRAEARQTGVYILIGEDDDGEMAYVGEAEDMANRLASHSRQKDWWDQAILITTAGDSLHKAHVRFLERRLVEIATDAAKVRLENGNSPGGASLNEAATANMESFLATLRMVLPAIRVNLLQAKTRASINSVSKPNSSQTSDYGDALEHVDSPVFELKIPKNNVDAKMQIVSGELVLLKGSKLRKGRHVADYLIRAQKTRQTLVSQSLLEEHETYDLLLGNFVFGSPSAAGDVASGRSCNGRLEWRTQRDQGSQTFAEWEEQQLRGLEQ